MSRVPVLRCHRLDSGQEVVVADASKFRIEWIPIAVGHVELPSLMIGGVNTTASIKWLTLIPSAEILTSLHFKDDRVVKVSQQRRFNVGPSWQPVARTCIAPRVKEVAHPSDANALTDLLEHRTVRDVVDRFTKLQRAREQHFDSCARPGVMSRSS